MHSALSRSADGTSTTGSSRCGGIGQTPRERKYLAAMSTLGEDHPRSAKVAEAMGSTAAGTSEVRNSAIKRGLIWATKRGRLPLRTTVWVFLQLDSVAVH